MEDKRIPRVIVDELLAFVQQNLAMRPELHIEDICISTFTKNEIEAARKKLVDSTLTTVSDVATSDESSDERGENHINTIMHIFENKDLDIPTFVARLEEVESRLQPEISKAARREQYLTEIARLRAEVAEIYAEVQNLQKIKIQGDRKRSWCSHGAPYPCVDARALSADTDILPTQSVAKSNPKIRRIDRP